MHKDKQIQIAEFLFKVAELQVKKNKIITFQEKAQIIWYNWEKNIYVTETMMY